MDPRDLGRGKAAAASFMAARGQSGQPRLAVQEPPITQLEWWVPSASGPDQSQVAAVPSASRAAFEQGLSAMLPMTYPQFQRVIDRFLVTWSPGLQGAVTYTSPEDPTLTQSVPIEVNLHDFEGDAVTVSIGSVGADGLTLTLTNVLSCDVQVDVVTMLEAGTSVTLVLHDETGAEIPSCAVAAGQALTVEVTGTGGASPAPADIGIVWHAMPTAEQLVGMCAGFIGTQLAKPAPVSLQVETLAGFFRPGVGPKRLTKLEVEFTGTDPPVKVELSAGATATANLTPPLLPALLNDPSALRFTYRVTNVYDDASTVVGPELAWDGGSPMIVEANPPEGQAHAAS
jgi:hypothetical protein